MIHVCCIEGKQNKTMKIYTEAELQEFKFSFDEYDVDNSGQLVFYSSVFLWSDGTFRDEEEPEVSGTAE